MKAHAFPHVAHTLFGNNYTPLLEKGRNISIKEEGALKAKAWTPSLAKFAPSFLVLSSPLTLLTISPYPKSL
jgi:hypothetical protein